MFSKKRKIELLKHVPLFGSCSQKELAQIAWLAWKIDFGPGKTLIREGTAGNEFFILVSGTAKITRKGRQLDTAGPGDFFGEMALLSNHARNATVTATSDVDALIIMAGSFRGLIKENPLIAVKVMRAVAERLPPDAFQREAPPANRSPSP